MHKVGVIYFNCPENQAETDVHCPQHATVYSKLDVSSSEFFGPLENVQNLSRILIIA